MGDGRFVHRKQEIDLNWPAGEAASTTPGPDGATSQRYTSRRQAPQTRPFMISKKGTL